MAPGPAVGAQFVLANAVSCLVVLGPFLDASDGKTPLTGLSIPYTETLISMNNGALSAKADTTSATELSNGFYQFTLGATDTASVGTLVDNVLLVSVNHTGALPVWKEFRVTPYVPY